MGRLNLIPYGMKSKKLQVTEQKEDKRNRAAQKPHRFSIVCKVALALGAALVVFYVLYVGAAVFFP